MTRRVDTFAAAMLASGMALAGCATVEEAVVEPTAETYNATLTGAQVVGGGDPDGTAKAEVSVADKLDQICYDLNNIANIGPITGAHIHRGAPGTNGPPVLPLKQANEGGWKGCTTAPEWLQNAVESHFTGYYVQVHTFTGYYVQVHTAEYPNGAIRGQLGP
jgi:hypothetical protein